MSKTQQLTILVALVSIFLLLFIVGVIKLPQSSPKSINNVNLQTKTGTSVTPSSQITESSLPITPNGQSVALVVVNYTLKGTLQKSTPAAEGTQFVLSSSDNAIPAITFSTTKQTKFSRIDPKGNELSASSFADLKLNAGDKLMVNAHFYPPTKTWDVRRVSLLITESLISPPPAPQKTP